VSERKRGPNSALTNPELYETVHRLMCADRRRSDFAQRFVRAQSGGRGLYIGCGPAHLVAHPPDVEYFGWEPAWGVFPRCCPQTGGGLCLTMPRTARRRAWTSS
jgi:hypothetical protein